MRAVDVVLALRLQDSAADRIQDIARHEPRLRQLSPGLRTAIVEARRQLSRELDQHRVVGDLSSRMAEGYFLFLAGQYQYLELGEPQQDELERLYRLLVLDFRKWLSEVPQHFETCPPLAAHHDRLAGWTRRALSEAGGLGWAEASDSVAACGTYSPELQLDLLRLEIGSLAEPVLDIGCGRDALLTAYLRERGFAAYGVDRLAAEGPGVVRGSWFDIPLARGSWGTVIAHLSFSLHFLNAHWSSSGRAVRHAEHYMRVLRALRPGGRFCYAPGLPFIEELLDPREYEVRTAPIWTYAEGAPHARRMDWSLAHVTRRSR